MAQIIAETTCPQCGAPLKVWLEPCDWHYNLAPSADRGLHTAQFAHTIDYWIDDADPVEVEVAT